MKKRKTAAMIIFLLFCIVGCGKNDESVVEAPQWEKVDKAEEGDAADGNESFADTEGEDGSGAERQTAAVAGLIGDQSFEVELDGWGKIFFASVAPADGKGTPRFLLLRDGETVYTFPETSEGAGGHFVRVSAVAFQDYNNDGKKDIIVLVTYGNGEDEWNEPEIFLQENLDNMFYLDHPELADYRTDGMEKGKEGFYRDTFLEEYLRKQRLTGSMAELTESWTDYVDYVDSLQGIFSDERQIRIFAENKEMWAEGMDYANERHCFTVASLGNDGRLTLIVANQGGTGNYTYSEFYKTDEKGELKRLETSFTEGDSQPDIMEESMTVYSSFSTEGIRNYFIVYDMLKDSPDSYMYRVSSLSLWDDFITETPLASQSVIYSGEDYSEQTISHDCYGNELTEEEYDNFPDSYYGGMGLTKQTASFKWMDVSSLEGKNCEEVSAVLNESYMGFSLK